jgi:transposase
MQLFLGIAIVEKRITIFLCEQISEAYRRHDINDRTWRLFEPHLLGREGVWGGIAHDDRPLLDAVFWIPRAGAPWRDLPPAYGDWKNTQRSFCRWRGKWVWEGLLEQLIVAPDYEWLMIDASHIQAHPHAAGARGGNQGMGRTKGGRALRCSWLWMRLVCRSESLSQTLPARIAHKRRPPNCGEECRPCIG